MVTKVSDGIMISVPEGTSRASTSRLVKTTSRSCMFNQPFKAIFATDVSDKHGRKDNVALVRVVRG